MYRLCHIAHNDFDVGHGGGAVLGKELDDGAADEFKIDEIKALNIIKKNLEDI